LAGPAFQAVAAQYPEARLTLAGGPDQLRLAAAGLPVAALWNAQRAVWLGLFQEGGEVPGELHHLLAGFDLALVFAPRQRPEFLDRFRRAGIPCVGWVPGFPTGPRLPIRVLQEEHLRRAGLRAPWEPFRLAVPEADLEQARAWFRTRGGGSGPLVALAPGSGHPRKNWPVASYARLAEALQAGSQVQVWWVLGPAEAGLLPELQKQLPHRELLLLKDLPLNRLAAILSLFQLHVGNDSGVTHLAAALGGPAVVALFGPSDPVIWAPPGERTAIVAADQPCAPCTGGREILCPDAVCLSALTPDQVLAVINRVSPGLTAGMSPAPGIP
jgi:hypothetical protein